VIAAKVLGGQVVCGQRGCIGTFGPLVEGTVWTSARYTWAEDAEPPRFRRGSRSRRRDLTIGYGEERPVHPSHGRSTVRTREGGQDVRPSLILPTVIECPRCHTVQSVDSPASSP
jgi:hypothetical protein